MRRLALALPFVFTLHVVEEAPGFVAWLNALVSPPITQSLFLSVNASAFVISVLVALVLRAAPEEPVPILLGVAG